MKLTSNFLLEIRLQNLLCPGTYIFVFFEQGFAVKAKSKKTKKLFGCYLCGPTNIDEDLSRTEEES